MRYRSGRIGKSSNCECRLRSNRPRCTNCGGPLARPGDGALGLLLLFPLFQHLVQGRDQLQQLFWIMFATGSFAKLQPALILEVRHIFLLLMSRLDSQLMAGEKQVRCHTQKINNLERERRSGRGLVSLSGVISSRGAAHFSTANYQLSFPKNQKGDVKQLRNGDAHDRVGGDLHSSA